MPLKQVVWYQLLCSVLFFPVHFHFIAHFQLTNISLEKKPAWLLSNGERRRHLHGCLAPISYCDEVCIYRHHNDHTGLCCHRSAGATDWFAPATRAVARMSGIGSFASIPVGQALIAPLMPIVMIEIKLHTDNAWGKIMPVRVYPTRDIPSEVWEVSSLTRQRHFSCGG